MIVSWANCSGGLNAGLSFWLPLDDLGAGAVNTTPASAAGSATPTFARATTATTILSNGLIGSVASGTPRSCYSPSGIYLGYLAEEARTNLCLQSADIATTWLATASTIGAATTGPDGTVSAKKLQEDNTSANHTVSQVVTKAASALVYTFSAYLKQAERTAARVRLDANSGNGFFVDVNLATGALGAVTALGVGWASGSATIVAAANGFWRVTLTATSDTATSVRGDIETENPFGTATYVGTTGSGIYAWGAQLEQAAFATSYIPTTTIAVARNADVLTYPTAGNIVTTVGAAYCEFVVNSGVSGGRLIASGASAAAPIQVATATAIGLYDGTNIVNSNAVAGMVTGGAHKGATRWGTSLARAFLDGGSGVEGAFTNDILGGQTSIGIGGQVGGSVLNGTIKNVRIWTRALADSQLVSLTS